MLILTDGTLTCNDCGRTWDASEMAGQVTCPSDDCTGYEGHMKVDVEREAAEKDFSELLDEFTDTERLRFEGRQGVESLCQIARAIGYKDPMYFGQLTHKAAVGDLIMMLEDNPGMVEVMVNWLHDKGGDEFKAALEETIDETREGGN